jgi:hypothetical protein
MGSHCTAAPKTWVELCPRLLTPTDPASVCTASRDCTHKSLSSLVGQVLKAEKGLSIAGAIQLLLTQRFRVFVPSVCQSISVSDLISNFTCISYLISDPFLRSEANPEQLLRWRSCLFGDASSCPLGWTLS